MKRWDDKLAMIGRHELFLGDNNMRVAQIKEENGEFLFSAQIGSVAYWNEPLESKTVEEAKKEAEQILVQKYKDAVCEFKNMIVLCEDKLRCLESEPKKEPEKPPYKRR